MKLLWYDDHNSTCMSQGLFIQVYAAVSVDEWKQDVYKCLSCALVSYCIEVSTFASVIMFTPSKYSV